MSGVHRKRKRANNNETSSKEEDNSDGKRRIQEKRRRIQNSNRKQVNDNETSSEEEEGSDKRRQKQEKRRRIKNSKRKRANNNESIFEEENSSDEGRQNREKRRSNKTFKKPKTEPENESKSEDGSNDEDESVSETDEDAMGEESENESESEDGSDGEDESVSETDEDAMGEESENESESEGGSDGEDESVSETDEDAMGEESENESESEDGLNDEDESVSKSDEDASSEGGSNNFALASKSKSNIKNVKMFMKLKKKMSIYKIDTSRLRNKVINNKKQLQKALIKEFEEDVTRKVLQRQKADCKQRPLEPYQLIWYVYKIQQKTNKNSEFLSQHLSGSEMMPLPEGYRQTSNLLLLYRLLNSGVPEVYCLCDSYPPGKLLCLADPKYRADVANTLMDDQSLTDIEVINIAGPEMTTKIKYRGRSQMHDRGLSFLSEVVASATSELRKDTKVYKELKAGGNEKIIRITIGLNFFRFEIKMDLAMCAKILGLLRDDINQRDVSVNFYNFGYVYRETGRELTDKFDTELKRVYIDGICQNKGNHTDISLSHRYLLDWMNSESVILKLKIIENRNQRTRYKKIEEWDHPPNVTEIAETLLDYTGSAKTVHSYLEKDRIYLSFEERNGYMSKLVQLGKFIHGSVCVDGMSAYKVAQKWFVLTSEFSEVVDENFCRLMKDVVVHSDSLLPIPWRKSTRQTGGITFLSNELTTFMGIDRKKTSQVLSLLTKKWGFVDNASLKSKLLPSSCTFLESSEIYKKLNKTIKRKKDNQISVSDFENALYESSEKRDRLDIRVTGRSDAKNVLAEKRKIISCRKENDTKVYTVSNPNLTREILNEIIDIVSPSSKVLFRKKLERFLRSRSSMTEGEYNETYLLHPQLRKKQGKTFYIPGDRILINNVELFDILMHDSKENITYLFHVKQGFGQVTRDVCSQIRISAKLLWRDRLNKKSTCAEEFLRVVNNVDSRSAYRCELKKRLKVIGEEQFKTMLTSSKLIFVYAFMHPNGKKYVDVGDFMPLTPSVFKEQLKINDKRAKTIFEALCRTDVLNKSGYLKDTFIGKTKRSFPDMVAKDRNLANAPKMIDKVYDVLKKHGRVDVSTIAKMELLELDREFSNYRFGNERIFELKILQL